MAKEFVRSESVTQGPSAPNLPSKFDDKTAIEVDRTGGAARATSTSLCHGSPPASRRCGHVHVEDRFGKPRGRGPLTVAVGGGARNVAALGSSRFEETGPGGLTRADPLRHGSPGAVAKPPLYGVRGPGQVLRSEPADVLLVVAAGARGRGSGGCQDEGESEGCHCGDRTRGGAAIEGGGVHVSAFLCLRGLDEHRIAGPSVDEPGQNWTAACAGPLSWW